MRNRRNDRLNIEGSHILPSRALATFTAEGLLVDRTSHFGLRGWRGIAGWSLWTLFLLAGPVQTSAFSDLRSQPVAPVAGAQAPAPAAAANQAAGTATPDTVSGTTQPPLAKQSCLPAN